MNPYKKEQLEHKTTKWLKEHCILECKKINEPSSWVQTCTNDERRYFLLNGTLDGYFANSDSGASTESSAATKAVGLEKLIIDAVTSKMSEEIQASVIEACNDAEIKIESEADDLYNELKEKVDRVVSSVKSPTIINVKNKPVLDSRERTSHEKLEEVFECLHYKQKVLLVGPAGTGKSTLVKDAWRGIAKDLGLDPKTSMQYIACSGGLSEAQLLGKMDANGDYHKGLVVDKFENGGLNLFDESDGFDPNVALVTHAMTDNQGFVALPNRTDEPMAFKHDNYYHAEVSNTWGDGMDFSYSGRMQQDGAKLDRFGDVKIWVDYDKNLEKELIGVYVDWAEMLWELRKRLTLNNLDRRFISTRRFYDAHIWAKVGKSRNWFLERITTDYTKEELTKIDFVGLLRSYK